MTLVLRFTPNDSCSWALAANWQQNRTTSRGLLQIEGTVQNRGERSVGFLSGVFLCFCIYSEIDADTWWLIKFHFKLSKFLEFITLRMHFSECHPQGMNHGPGVLIGKNVTLFLCTSWSWLMYCQFCPRRICMQRNASTIRGWGGGGGGGGHFKGFGGSNSSSSPSMTFHSSFNLLYMSLLLMTARPSLCLMDCNRPTTATTQSWLNDKPVSHCQSQGREKIVK